MRQFMDENFLLQTETAQKLYHDYAEHTPILDYHCHINRRKSTRTGSLRTLPRYGWAVTIINGALCVPAALTSVLSPGTLPIRKSF